MCFFFFFFSSRRRHTRYWRDWSSECALPISLSHKIPKFFDDLIFILSLVYGWIVYTSQFFDKPIYIIYLMPTFLTIGENPCRFMDLPIFWRFDQGRILVHYPKIFNLKGTYFNHIIKF